MNTHVKHLVIDLLLNRVKGGLVIHPNIEDMKNETIVLLGSLGQVPVVRGNTITFPNDSRIKFSTGEMDDYKSCTFHIVYIHENNIDAERLGHLQEAIPKGGLIMRRVI